jgi:hypothetical protein
MQAPSYIYEARQEHVLRDTSIKAIKCTFPVLMYSHVDTILKYTNFKYMSDETTKRNEFLEIFGSCNRIMVVPFNA